MKNNKGIFTVEVVASLGIVLMIVFTFIPIIYHIKLEEQTLSQRRNIHSLLDDKLQSYLYTEQYKLIPEERTSLINNQLVDFSFTQENRLVKGCVTWTNAKKVKEQFCLYGYPKK